MASGVWEIATQAERDAFKQQILQVILASASAAALTAGLLHLHPIALFAFHPKAGWGPPKCTPTLPSAACLRAWAAGASKKEKFPPFFGVL